VADEKKFAKFFLVSVPDGEYDQYIANIRFNMTLRRLGYTVKKFSEPPIEYVISSPFFSSHSLFQLSFRPLAGEKRRNSEDSTSGQTKQRISSWMCPTW